MSNFNWQTEDDVTWDDLAPVTETAVPRRRPWLTYALIVAGVIMAVALIYRQVNQRIEAATANATSDILASHTLVQQAGIGQDVELFNNLLSGRDPDWVDVQSELLQMGNLFDRSAFDLTWLPSPNTAVTLADVESGAIGVDINPELNAVELTFLQDYAVAVGNGVTETVQLRQTAVYRMGTQRWLYAPPDAEFWGEFESITGSMVNLAYPARDADVAQRLSFDLDAKLAEMCRTLADLNCPDGFRLSLRLDSDPQSFLDAAQLSYALRSGPLLTLPTPTLVGLPLDEAGYQALKRGYAIHLVGAAIAELTEYDCCRNVDYFQALLDYQLDELGIRPLNLDRVDYERVVRENIGFETLATGWRIADDLRGEADWLVITAVAFMRHQIPDISIANLQRKMNGRRSLSDWLLVAVSDSDMVIEGFSSQYWNSRWRSFTFEQYQARQEPLPLPLPAQDVYLLCMPSQGVPYSELYQYQPAGSEWIQHPLDVSALSLNQLLDDEALLLQDFGGEELRTSLWQDGDNQLLFENETITFGQFDPTGQYLLVYSLGQNAPGINRVDWTACATGDCAVDLLGGNPVWSPQGTDFIMLPADSLGEVPFVVNGRTFLFDSTMTPSEWILLRGNGQPPTASLETLTGIGTGYAPFWLDESTFGYIRQIPISSDSNRHELVIMNIIDELPQPILTETDLQRVLSDDLSATSRVLMLYATSHPQQPDHLFIVSTIDDREIAIFSYNIQTNDVQYRLKTGINGNHSLSFSLDGRYLVVTGADDGLQLFEDQRNNIYLYDLVTDQVQTFAGTNLQFAPSNTFDWSADGQWLVIAQENEMITLIAPAHDYQQFIPHNLGDCANVAWLNQ